MAAEWIIEGTPSPRFPYRIRIEQKGRVLLCVRAQDRWPGPGGQIFCLRDREWDASEILEPVERVPVAHVTRLGRKLSVTLDRPMRKRCEFLRVEKQGKNGATYEQIFFRTELSARTHRSSRFVELKPLGDLEIVVDSGERHAWRFPGARVTRRKLPSGDYALIVSDRPVAVVERKSLVNFLGDVSRIKALHQQLADLGSYPHAALVIEAQYADLGKPDKIGKWPPAHLLRVAAEISALHPQVPTIYAGNRKLANTWTHRFFAAVAAHRTEAAPALVREPAQLFETTPEVGRLDTRIRIAIMRELPDGFAFPELRERFRGVADGRLRRVLHQLRKEGRVRCEGHGRAGRWHREVE